MPLNEKIDAFRKELEQEARNNASDIFEVSTNVKGYRSKRDL
jgi:hypothetical protein